MASPVGRGRSGPTRVSCASPTVVAITGVLSACAHRCDRWDRLARSLRTADVWRTGGHIDRVGDSVAGPTRPCSGSSSPPRLIGCRASADRGASECMAARHREVLSAARFLWCPRPNSSEFGPILCSLRTRARLACKPCGCRTCTSSDSGGGFQERTRSPTIVFTLVRTAGSCVCECADEDRSEL